MNSISPLDGRYSHITKDLQHYFSEFSFFKYRLYIELKYFIHLTYVLPELIRINRPDIHDIILNIWKNFSENDYHSIKKYEQTTNHDIKALEYFIRDKFKENNLETYNSFIHFAITSQDINTSANVLALKNAMDDVMIPAIKLIIDILNKHSDSMKDNIMLAFTHGQPAVPTTMGKELSVFAYRLEEQLDYLSSVSYSTKFGGAVGNFNAHYLAYPDIDWIAFSEIFINQLGLTREKYTTQISNYDNLCNLLNCIRTINNIINDMNIDCWLYISKNYFQLSISNDEVGSSTMPQKINPIHFENSEGNICIANSLIEGITRKLPVSRLQRDLTDSTILRNLGTVLGYCLLSYHSSYKGLSRIKINTCVIIEELNKNIAVLTEGVQTILRKHNDSNAYEKLVKLSRQQTVTMQILFTFIYSLPKEQQNDLIQLNITNYKGNL
tara:strand:- start:65 stop:1384 length:1320 start_codon:yes stop_codon:yes gene_type:complete